MRGRLPALALYARRVPSVRGSVVETAASLLGVLRHPHGALRRHLRFLDRNSYESLSYLSDWLAALQASPRLDVQACNIADWSQYLPCMRRIDRFPLVFVMHSALGDDPSLLTLATSALKARRGKLVVFVANEYNLMSEKIGFARAVQADYIASQLPAASAAWLYAECAGARILQAPAALNPSAYRPTGGRREVDIGFRGDAYSLALGDVERHEVIEYVRRHAPDWGLRADIAFARLPASEWSAFLSRCRGIVGAESGTYFLERDGRTERAVSAYLERHPRASFTEVYEHFYRGYRNPISGKAISSRHFEPIGTKTCQILLEGHYNGILAPDVHYISVKKDYSNVDDVIARFKDQQYVQRITDEAYRFVHGAHTYAHRITSVLEAVLDRGTEHEPSKLGG
jgi:hypothetical protein